MLNIPGMPPIPEAPADDPPTEKQCHFLEKYREKVPATKEQASKIIAEIIEINGKFDRHLNRLSYDPKDDDPYWDDHR